MRRSAVPWAVVVASAALSVGASALSAPRTPAAAAVTTLIAPSRGAQATGVDITYTSKTVLIPAALVAQQLLGVSANGSTYTFKSKTGPLAALAPGKVMFLQGKAVGDVKAVSSAGGRLVVTTSPPSVTDLIKSGTVDVDAPVTFAGGTAATETEPAAQVSLSAARRGGTARSGRLDALSAVATLAAAGRTSPRPSLGSRKPGVLGTGTYSGTTGGIDYTANISRATERLDFTVNYTYDKDGFIAQIDTSGYLDTFAAHLQMLINNDVTKSSAFFAKPLDGHLHLTWRLGRGPDGQQTFKVPAFTVPFSFNFPFIVGGLPFFVKVEFQALFTVSLSAKNATMEGGVDLDYDGSGGGLTAGASLSPQGSESVHGNFLPLPSMTPIASGAVIAVDAPKLSFGMGLPVGLSGFGYVDLISSLGETTGSLIAGQSCEKDDLDFTVKVGVGAEFITSIPGLPSKDPYTKHASYSQPGC
jgi:hypothetical protein